MTFLSPPPPLVSAAAAAVERGARAKLNEKVFSFVGWTLLLIPYSSRVAGGGGGQLVAQ